MRILEVFRDLKRMVKDKRKWDELTSLEHIERLRLLLSIQGYCMMAICFILIAMNMWSMLLLLLIFI